MAAEAAPTWKGIIEAADKQDASLIVLGSHGRSGLSQLVGSVASAVAAHSRRSVLIVHRR
jgi:nucleotide-binding universal stress UspA family protein